jgi:MinD-like ATPase involved in chromosome partitioning or flagellar assembly
MDVYAVTGGDGSGKTATALNLTVALRAAGAHAAVLDADLGGNVSSLLDVKAEATLAAVLDGEAGLREALDVRPLSAEGLPECDLVGYRRALAADRTGFRAGGEGAFDDADEEDPDVDSLPVVVGFESRDVHVGTNPDRLGDVLSGLEMAYEALIVDAGNGPLAESPLCALADGALVVTTTDPAKSAAAKRAGAACTERGCRVVGAVVNRAGETTNVTTVTEAAGTRAVGVVPEDARTAALEPVAFTFPGAPAGVAYGRLADAMLGWDGSSGGLGPTPTGSAGDASDGTDVAVDGEGEGERGSDEEREGGFLSRLFGGD